MTENNIGKFTDYGQPDFAMEEIATPESNHPALQQLKDQIANLESSKQAQSDTILRLRDKYRTAEYSLEAVLKELLDDEEISIENAQKIAEIFDGITLTKQIEIAYTITATATIEVPYGADPDEVADSTYVERVEFYTDFENAEILESDHEAEDWNVR
jgi:hypothetical protein